VMDICPALLAIGAVTRITLPAGC